jgi:hypothetical protein
MTVVRRTRRACAPAAESAAQYVAPPGLISLAGILSGAAILLCALYTILGENAAAAAARRRRQAVRRLTWRSLPIELLQCAQS